MAVGDLAAQVAALAYEAALRRGMTVAEWDAWWADPENRRLLDEAAPVAPVVPPAVEHPRRPERPDRPERPPREGV